MNALTTLYRETGRNDKKNRPFQPLRFAGLWDLGWNLLLLTTILLIVGCGSSSGSTSGEISREASLALPTDKPTPVPSPSSTRVMPLEDFTPTPTAFATPTITPIPEEVRGLVVDVIDGNTITVVLEGDPPGRAYEVRYIGINAPANESDDPWGVVAYETNQKRTNMKVVRLVQDQTDQDDEGRLLRYVYVGDELMSIIIAEQGLARADINEPNTRFEEEILEAEARARAGRLGLWGQEPTPTPGLRQPASAVTTEATTPAPETATPEPTLVETSPAAPTGTPSESSTGSSSETPVQATTESGTPTN